MKIFEVTNSDSLYYHGSYEPLKVGTILTPRENYELNWAGTDFYWLLENHRPNNMLSHKQSVFMASDPDDDWDPGFFDNIELNDPAMLKLIRTETNCQIPMQTFYQKIKEKI